MFYDEGIVINIANMSIGLWQITIQSDRGPDVIFRMRNSQCYIALNDRLQIYIDTEIYGKIPYASTIYNITRGANVL